MLYLRFSLAKQAVAEMFLAEWGGLICWNQLSEYFVKDELCSCLDTPLSSIVIRCAEDFQSQIVRITLGRKSEFVFNVRWGCFPTGLIALKMLFLSSLKQFLFSFADDSLFCLPSLPSLVILKESRFSKTLIPSRHLSIREF